MRLLSVCVVCLCAWLSHGSEIGIRMDPIIQTRFKRNTSSPIEFPQKPADSSTPILIGNDPKSGHLPPKMFPSGAIDHNPRDPPVLSGSEANIMEMENNSHETKPNSTHVNTASELANSTVTANAGSPLKGTEKGTGEQDDMLHSKYKGGQDVDELLKPDKKATEKDEKKPIVPKKEPKSEIETSEHFDKTGPKLMNDTKTKSGDSMLESTSKMMAVSSSVLSSTKAKHRGIIEPAKTVASVLLSIAVVLCLGVIGLLVWKKISMRRFGRDVLINEDDFDEVSDMHTFDRAQIQIT